MVGRVLWLGEFDCDFVSCLGALFTELQFDLDFWRILVFHCLGQLFKISAWAKALSKF